jgi:hypothetical protein
LFEISGHTGWGFANAGATNQLWFYPVVDQVQGIGIQITTGGSGVVAAGLISLMDLTSGSELWNYGWVFRRTNNIPWTGGGLYGNLASFNVDTDFLGKSQARSYDGN